MRAISTPLRFSGFQPVRIFSVTGTSTALTTALIIASTVSGYWSSAEPASFLLTFLAGQPILMSMICAPFSTLNCAAWAISSGSAPAICTERMPSSPSWFIRACDLAVFQTFGLLESISETTRPAPKRLQSWRNGLSVTPAMGANIKLFSNS